MIGKYFRLGKEKEKVCPFCLQKAHSYDWNYSTNELMVSRILCLIFIMLKITHDYRELYVMQILTCKYDNLKSEHKELKILIKHVVKEEIR